MTVTCRLRAWIRLSLCRSVGPITANSLLVELDAAGMPLEDFFDLPEDESRQFLAKRPTLARALKDAALSDRLLDQLVKRLEQKRIRLIPINDPLYPRRLLSDLGLNAPAFLYSVGNLSHLRAPTIAMIGTRQASPLGIETARAYAAALARAGIHVVSGHAWGIDLASHEAALAAGGTTTLVVPRGILEFRLARSLRGLATRRNTLVLSQFSPMEPGSRALPVLRNTTVAALCDGLMVVETGLRGGSSYAFRAARRMRKPLWTVVYPKPVAPSAAGNRSLLSSGAQALEAGRTGARRCVAHVVQQLRRAHSQRPKLPVWPPEENPDQQTLF